MKKFCKKLYERICDWCGNYGNASMFALVLSFTTLLIILILSEIITRVSYDEKYYVCDSVVLKDEQISSWEKNHLRLEVVVYENMRIYEWLSCKSLKIVYRYNVDKEEDAMKKKDAICNTKDMMIGLDCQ